MRCTRSRRSGSGSQRSHAGQHRERKAILRRRQNHAVFIDQRQPAGIAERDEGDRLALGNRRPPARFGQKRATVASLTQSTVRRAGAALAQRNQIDAAPEVLGKHGFDGASAKRAPRRRLRAIGALPTTADPFS